MSYNLDFYVPASLDAFFMSEKFISLAVGPVGSLKTTTALAKIMFHASRMAPCEDGIRRSRAVWVRNTREQLRDTSVPDFLRWYPDGVMGTFAKTENKFTIRVGEIECEVLFRGLDDSNDVRRLLSLQASFGVLEEFREINPDIFEALQGRLGRYPDKKLVPPRPEWGTDARGYPIGGCVTDSGVPNKHLWGVTNPPDFDTYWQEILDNPPDNVDVSIQPSALSPEADWLHFLDSTYYENLAEGKTEDWIDVYIHARFGKSLSGKPVFRAFNRDVHLSKNPLKHNPVSGEPVLIGLDIALNPAAVIGQMAYDGRLMVLRSMCASGMGVLRFIRERLKPALTTYYPGARVLVVVDPSGTRRMDTDEATVVSIVKKEGLAVVPARTNRLPPRIAAVDNFLTRMVDGRPAMLIDPENNGELIKALAGRYRYKTKKPGTREEQSDEVPEKLHPWSDLADALQYLCIHADNGSVMGATMASPRREVKKSNYVWV